MKVKLLTSIYCPYGNFGKGAEAELPNKIAKGLIAGNHAVEIADEKAKEEEAEQKATKLPAKKTTRQPAKKVTAKK
jgi:hypothetical protein